MSRFIPLSIPNFEGNERKYVDDAVKQGWVSTGGAYITKLEENMANFLGVKEVAACQSGTSGIHLSLIEAGVVPGDMVIVPTLTFIAAVNIITQIVLNVALNIVNYNSGSMAFTFYFILFEIAVFAVEAAVYSLLLKKFSSKPAKRGKDAAYAFAANLASFATGLWLAHIIPGIF